MRPNILLFMPDQLRWDWVGPGNRGGALTPNLDALMARGTTFRNAITPSPVCGPTRACLTVGREYDRSGVPNNHYDTDLSAPNFYRNLARSGYQVLTCGKIDLLKSNNDWGADGQHTQDGQSRLHRFGFTGGFDCGGKHGGMRAYREGQRDPYLDYLRDRGLLDAHAADFEKRRNLGLAPGSRTHPGPGPNYLNLDLSPLPEDAYQDDWIGGHGIALMQQAMSGSAPFFLQVNLAGPHEPMNITPAMAASVIDRNTPLPDILAGIPEETHVGIRRAYTAMIERIDDILGRFVEALTAAGQLDNTVIVFVSDHGDMLGDCGLWEKFVPHDSALRIPMVFAGPGISEGGVAETPTSFLDLHATFIEMAGADVIPDTDSRSMVEVLADPSKRHRDVAYSGLGNWRLAFDGRFKALAGYDPALPWQLTRDSDFDAGGPFVLIDSATDFAESTDVSVEHPEVAAKLFAALKHQRSLALSRP